MGSPIDLGLLGLGSWDGFREVLQNICRAQHCTTIRLAIFKVSKNSQTNIVFFLRSHKVEVSSKMPQSIFLAIG